MSQTFAYGELELGHASPLSSNVTTDHAPAAGGSVPPLPPRFPRRRRGGDPRPSRKEELVRQAAMFSAGFLIALLVSSLIARGHK
jgi:hypothetical protein